MEPEIQQKETVNRSRENDNRTEQKPIIESGGMTAKTKQNQNPNQIWQGRQ